MIAWKETLTIIKKTFGTTQSKMGELLGYDKTTISKVKSGKQSPPFSNEDVFEKIFNPHVESPAKAISTSEVYLLGVLKEIIQEEFPAVKSELHDCWEETDYKTFVMELLGRTRQSIMQKQISGVLISKGNPTPERMVDTFYQAINGFAVEDFMEGNSVNSLSSDRIGDMFRFIGCIRQKDQDGDSPDKGTDIYTGILQFTDALLEYIRFLKSACANPDNFPENYQPPKDDEEFLEMADRRRHQLMSLYQPLQEKVDKIMDEEYEQRRKEHKRSWDENTQKGIL